MARRKKDKGIYKRGKYWWIRYASGGKMVYESSGSIRHEDAETLLYERKAAIRRGEHPETAIKAKHTLSDLAPEYLKWAERQRGIVSKRSMMNSLVKVFGSYTLNQLASVKEIEVHQTNMLNAGMRPATVNRYLAILKHAYTKAVEWGMASEDALKRVRRVKLLPENNWRLRYLSVDECHDLIANCEDYLRPIVVTALNSGMRKGEILSLTWDRVDLRHGVILLDKTKSGHRREIPINDSLRATLTGLIRRLDVPYVFFDSATGKRWYDIQRPFQRACRKAGIRDFKFHDTRHTFASLFVMGGGDLYVLKELLGHKTITMTMRYAHLSPSHRARAMSIMDRLFEAKTGDSETRTIQKQYNREVEAVGGRF